MGNEPCSHRWRPNHNPTGTPNGDTDDASAPAVPDTSDEMPLCAAWWPSDVVVRARHSGPLSDGCRPEFWLVRRAPSADSART